MDNEQKQEAAEKIAQDILVFVGKIAGSINISVPAVALALATAVAAAKTIKSAKEEGRNVAELSEYMASIFRLITMQTNTTLAQAGCSVRFGMEEIPLKSELN